ncbi:YqaA family protein [Polycyclovorans algicola]|uniref:YqaA family protein n=1 Tax=Polycyclovorans algicola TaxID=616992 RepID=UPI0005B9C24C|nr:YqaA family protein [Polycyclovorans algicola]
MNFFRRLYDWTLNLSRHPRAPWWLGGLSAAESVFFPIPPDIMLAPMVLVRPHRWWKLALLTTVTSVLGGLVGYALGYWLLDLALPMIERMGKLHAYETASAWFERYGFWAMFLAGLTPIPFKVFTVSAGAAHLALVPFMVGSVVGRGMRFFLVAGLARLLGPAFEQHLLRYIDLIGWVMLALVAIGLIWLM